MANLPEDGDRTNHLKQLREALDLCLTFDVDELLRGARERLPESFEIVAPVRELIPCLELCRELGRYDIESFRFLPQGFFPTVLGAVTNTIETLRKMSSFRLTGAGNDLDTFKQITAPIAGTATKWFSGLTTALTFVRRNDADLKRGSSELDAQRASIEALRAETQQIREGLEADIKQKLETADKALQAAQAAAIQRGILKQGLEFHDATERYEKAATWWGRAAAVSATLILVFCAVVVAVPSELPYPELSWTVAGNLGYFSVRALSVSVVSFLMVISVRNYRSAKHNEMMNAHRTRALATFRQFTTGADATIAQTVTLQAAEAVFAVQSSGYGDGPVGSTHVAELAAVTFEKK